MVRGSRNGEWLPLCAHCAESVVGDSRAGLSKLREARVKKLREAYQLRASNQVRQAGRQPGARAHHQGSGRAERAKKTDKVSRLGPHPGACVRASPPARRLTAACARAALSAPGDRAF